MSGPPTPPASRDHGWPRPANEPRPVGNTHTISPRRLVNIEPSPPLWSFIGIVLLVVATYTWLVLGAAR